MKDNRSIAKLFANVQHAVDELKAKLIEEGVIEEEEDEGGVAALGPGAGEGGGGGGEDPPVDR